MTHADLEASRAELADRLATLKMSSIAADLVRQADAAVAEFREQADALERQIAEIDATMGIRARDRRAAAEREAQERREAQRKALFEQEEMRLQAFERAEMATRTLVRSIDAILAANAHMARLAQELSAPGRTALNQMDLIARISGRVASVLATIKGHRHRFGSLEWPAGASGLYPPDRSWREDEEKRMAAAFLQPLSKEQD